MHKLREFSRNFKSIYLKFLILEHPYIQFALRSFLKIQILATGFVISHWVALTKPTNDCEKNYCNDKTQWFDGQPFVYQSWMGELTLQKNLLVFFYLNKIQAYTYFQFNATYFICQSLCPYCREPEQPSNTVLLSTSTARHNPNSVYQ